MGYGHDMWSEDFRSDIVPLVAGSTEEWVALQRVMIFWPNGEHVWIDKDSLISEVEPEVQKAFDELILRV